MSDDIPVPLPPFPAETDVIPEKEDEPIPTPIPVPQNNQDQEDMEFDGKMEEDNDTLSSSFPVMEMSRLDEMISNPRWVVPVLPGGQLEILLDSAINLCKKGKS